MMNADGTNQTRLTNDPFSNADPAFSPDGGKIAFVSTRDGNHEIYVMNADGINQTRLTNDPAYDGDPAFSPDGSMIAFTSFRNFNNSDIYMMNADGTNQTRLTNNPGFDEKPSWALGSVVSLAASDVTAAEGNAGATQFTFTVTKSGTATRNVTVRVNTADGTATAAGSDYAPIVNQTLTFLPAETSKTVTVTVNGDAVAEPDETFFVNLSNPTDALLGDAQGVGAIVNDDGAFQTLPNLLQVIFLETTNGTLPTRYAPGAPELTTRRSDPLTSGNNDFSFFDEEYYDVFYSNADGAPNPTGAFITVEGVWRLQNEPFGGMNINEVELLYQNGSFDFADFITSFVLGSFCNPGDPDAPEQCLPGSEARAVDNMTGTFPRFGHTSNMNLNERFRLTVGFNGISPAPPPEPTLQFSLPNFTVVESAGSASLQLIRTGDTQTPVSVDFTTTVDGTANQRTDYTFSSGTVDFAAGETSKTILIIINDDLLTEGNETFFVVLRNPRNGAALGAPDAATVTIQDNDGVAPNNNRGVGQLDPAQQGQAPESPAVAAGSGSVTLINNNTQAQVNLSFTGLSSTQTAAHIHGPAHVGVNAPVLFTLPLGTVTNRVINLTPAQVAQLKAGLFYFDIHTFNSPNGEIRGQILFNPLESARFFVRQQYADFLARAPDTGGFDFWTGQIVNTCGADLACIRQRRVDVSNAFFFELEFQKTGSFVYRLYRAAFGNNVPANLRNPDATTSCAGLPPLTLLGAHLPRYDIFAADRARLDAAQLAASQLALANNFVTRPEFIALYPASQTAEQFVDALLGTIQSASGANLSSQRTALINLHNTSGRGAVLYRLADDDAAGNPINNRAFIDAEYNRAFVTTQYFGYLRRDGDVCGLNFWLNLVNQFPLRSPASQNGMVCAFVTSGEYQERFSLGVTRANQECPAP
jgi:hypothetical protein